MIIDKILDRKENRNTIVKNGVLSTTTEYSPKGFYDCIVQYGKIGWDILNALDSGTEKEVKRSLCEYIKDQEYDIGICEYIRSINWLQASK